MQNTLMGKFARMKQCNPPIYKCEVKHMEESEASFPLRSNRWLGISFYSLFALHPIASRSCVLCSTFEMAFGFSFCCFVAFHFFAMHSSVLCSTFEMASEVNLPEHICVGYANWHQSDDSIVDAVRRGVNVVIWFSIDLIKNRDGKAAVQRGPNMDEVARLVAKIRDLNLECVHLMSIGGWNAPHPDATLKAEEVFEALDEWNRKTCARPQLGFYGFDGFDWDVEGNDDFDSRYNEFSVECLDLMGKVSQLAKQRGYIMSMAPAESYLDPTTSEFSLSLAHNHPEWMELQPNFNYRGRNSYAPFLAKYGTTTVERRGEGKTNGDAGTCVVVDTFDFVTVQLYEGYSHAEYQLRHAHKTPADVFVGLAQKLHEGWWVHFDSTPALQLPSQRLSVPHTKLVIGLANKWAGDGKFLFMDAEEIAQGHTALVDASLTPKGYAFWNMKDEGIDGFYMASTLNRILGIR